MGFDEKFPEVKNYLTLQEEEGYAIMTLSREGDPYNTFNPGYSQALRRGFAYCDESPNIKGLIITGAGRVFSAGADVAREFEKLDANGARRMAIEGDEINALIEQIGTMVVAAINGLCLAGGLELALACDYRIASNKSILGQPEINLGLIPGWGGTQRLPRLIGRSRAIRVICGGEHFRADEAHALGIVDEVVPHEKLMTRATELASLFGKKSKPAIRMAKMAVNQGLHLPLWYGLKLESELFSAAWNLNDRVEGVKAFLEKRKAKFTDS